MANIDLTTASAAVKVLYDGQKLTDLVYTDNPLLAMVKKNTKSGGVSFPVPLIYGTLQGRSATFLNAQSNVSGASMASFSVTRAKDYAIARIDNETLEATKGDDEAFISAAELAVDQAFRAITLSLASALFRSGTGSIGKISTFPGSGAITLTDPNSVVNFEVGQVLTAHATDGAAARAALGYVIAVNRSAGSLTVSASAGGAAGDPAAWAANDFLYQQGDINLKIKGLAAWIPTSAPSSTAFFGVDRSVDTVRLGGVRYDGSSMPIEEAITEAVALVTREGGAPKHCFMGYTSWAALEKSLGSRVQYDTLKSEAGIMFQSIKVNGPKGVIHVIPDRNCPGQLAYLLDMSTWELRSVNKAPHILSYDKEGLEMLRVSNEDAAELRVGYYAQLVCNAPGWNAVIQLGA